MNKRYALYALAICIGIAACAIGAVKLIGPDVQAQGVVPLEYQFGNHNLHGTYEFHADGAVEVDGLESRGMWEVGRFYADGKGNFLNGVEYSNMLSSDDESIIDVPYTFEGTYNINPNGIGKGTVSVYIPAADITIVKSIWFVVNQVDETGIAQGFAHGHSDADLGGGAHGNARTHVGTRMNPRRTK